MNFGSYLKDRIPSLVILVFTVALVQLVLWVYGIDVLVSVVIGFIILLAAAAAFTLDYLRKRRFYAELEGLLRNKEAGEAYYLSELIERPGFAEGKLLYDSLEQGNKDMNDRIAKYRLASEEYQEYVETWIHEIKTPLAASRLIIANKGDAELRSLENELDRTESYVEQALFYARGTAVEKDYVLQSVNLDSLVKTAVKKQSRILIEQGITPEFENLDQQVYTDPKWLDFILSQIISNAARYVNPASEGRAPRLTFTAERKEQGLDGGKVILHIEDNGIGIPAHDVKRVFEKGFTGENGRLYAKSTGIGLYLCKKLCARMKLAISVSSVWHESTTVSIEFSLNKMYFVE